MLVTLEAIRSALRCPACRRPLAESGPLRCTSAECPFSSTFPSAGPLPVLIDFPNSIIPREFALAPRLPPRHNAFTKFKNWAGCSNNVADRNENLFVELLRKRPARQLVLNIGGGTIGSGMSALYDAPDIDQVAFDVYASPNIAFIADAHAIPLRDGSVDAVWIQAVLEHVLDPRQVVEEIERVLKPGGLVYVETPFMQHVHMGPFDFTRWTHSGHRWLLRGFEEIESGTTAGAGTQFAWAARHLAIALTRSRWLGRLAHFLSFPIVKLDRLCNQRANLDAASGYYFLGTKQAVPMKAAEIVAYYRGFQQ